MADYITDFDLDEATTVTTNLVTLQSETSP